MPLEKIDPNDVPPDIRAKALQRVDPSSLPPEIRMAGEKARMEAEAAMTPEQRYERLIGKAPSWAKWALPGTMGEAAYAGTAGLEAAATPFGLRLPPPVNTLAPIIAATTAGAFEDPQHRLQGALLEGGKAIGQDLIGRGVSKGLELAGRGLTKVPMLEATATRIGKAIPGLFHRWPLKGVGPTTARDLEGTLGTDRLLGASGRQIEDYADLLEQGLGKYKPAVKAQLVPAAPGVPFHYTVGSPASGTPFKVPVIHGDSVVMEEMGIKDAIMQVRSLQAAALGSAGTVKRTAGAPITADIAADARDSLTKQLNAINPQLKMGDHYRGLSTDYGLAKRLQGVFKGVRRADGEIDQPKLLTKLRQNVDVIDRLKPGKGQQLLDAVAPTGASAIPEKEWGFTAHSSTEGGLRGLFHPPHPYYPETPQMLPPVIRLIAKNPQLRPLVGALGYQTAEGATFNKGEQ